MKKAILSLSLVGVLSACGGGGDGSKDGGSGAVSPPPVQASDEITVDNALQVASVAERATTRLVSYKELGLFLSYGVSFHYGKGDVICTYDTGAVGMTVQTLNGSSYLFSLKKCTPDFKFSIESGDVAVNSYLTGTVKGLTTTAFLSQPSNAVIVDAAGSGSASGNVSYTMTSSTSAVGYAVKLSGQLDFTVSGKTDQYRNFALAIDDKNWTNAAIFTLNLSSLEIASPRIAVQKMLVSTPVPINIDTLRATQTGGFVATSAKDGSHVQWDALGPKAFRLRCWNSKGALVLDTNKNMQDSDVVAARANANS